MTMHVLNANQAIEETVAHYVTDCTHMTKKEERQKKRQPFPHPGLKTL